MALTVDGGASWRSLPSAGPSPAVVFTGAGRLLYASGFPTSSVRTIAPGDARPRTALGLPRAALDFVASVGDAVVASGPALDGVVRSANGGRTWTDDGASPAFQQVPVALAERAGGGLLGIAARPFRADPAGALAAAATGLPRHARVATVVAAPARSIALAEGSGLLSSTDGGASWSPLARQPYPAAVLFGLVASAGGRLLVAAGSRNRFATSADGGASWQPLPRFRARSPIAEVGLAGRDLVVTLLDGTVLGLPAHGRRWQRVLNRPPLRRGQYPFAPTLVLGGGRRDAVVFREDGTWRVRDLRAIPLASHGLPPAAARSAVDPQRIAAVARGALRLSEDGGTTWRTLARVRGVGSVAFGPGLDEVTVTGIRPPGLLATYATAAAALRLTRGSAGRP